jgi:transposase
LLVDGIGRYSLEVCDWKGLLERIERIRMRVARELNRPVELISCYEAGYDGFWLHRLLEAHGVRNYVIDAASLHVDRRARRTKTDHIDAVQLLRSLMAYLRGEPKVWSVVRVPGVAEEDERRQHRERHRLIAERVQHVNRIKGLCAVHGIYDYEPFGQIGCYDWSDCERAMDANCHDGSERKSYANCSASSSCCR